MEKRGKKDELIIEPLNEYARLASVIGGFGLESSDDIIIISFLSPALGEKRKKAYVFSRVALSLDQAEKFVEKLKNAIDEIRKMKKKEQKT